MKNNTPGIFILSLDTELAWGTFDKNGLIKYQKHFFAYRSLINKLLELLKKYEIKATWAFVGHLFLDDCREGHSEFPFPEYLSFKKNWHFHDPHTNIKKDPFWYGKDILKKVKNAYPVQEIGAHTFSHFVIGNKSCPKETAYIEIKKCLDLAKQENVNIKSLVFPRNEIGHLNILRELGIKTFRGYKNKNKILRIADQIFARTPSTYFLKNLKIKNGVLEIPDSMFLTPYDGVRKFLPSFIRVLRIKKGLKKAAKEGSVFHLWFHPFNLGSSPKMFDDLEKSFKSFAKLRDSSKIINLTMKEIADYEK